MFKSKITAYTVLSGHVSESFRLHHFMNTYLFLFKVCEPFSKRSLLVVKQKQSNFFLELHSKYFFIPESSLIKCNNKQLEVLT